MKTICLLIALVVSIANAQNASQILECYFCDSEKHSDCEIVSDDTLRYRCDEMEYGDTTRSLSNGKRQYSLLSEISHREVSRSAIQNIDYKCISIVFLANEKRNLVRTCMEVRNNIDNICDFIKAEIKPGTTVKRCDECNDNLCNSSLSITSNIILMLSTLILACFLAKY